MKFLRVALAVMLILGLSTSAFAGKYSDEFTREDSSGSWDFDENVNVGGDLHVTGTTTILGSTYYIAEVTNTPATITSALTGRTYVASGNTIVTFTLPAAATGLSYKFISGDGSGMVIRTSDTLYTSIYDDIFMWGTDEGSVVTLIPVTSTQLRVHKMNDSRGALGVTGFTIEVIGGSHGHWFVNPSSPTTIDVETRGTNPAAPSGV